MKICGNSGKGESKKLKEEEKIINCRHSSLHIEQFNVKWKIRQESIFHNSSIHSFIHSFCAVIIIISGFLNSNNNNNKWYKMTTVCVNERKGCGISILRQRHILMLLLSSTLELPLSTVQYTIVKDYCNHYFVNFLTWMLIEYN